MPTAELLAALPSLVRTLELTRALAVLDAVMSEDWESRYYSFDAAWDKGERMASMRNGSGDDWFCWFGAPGSAIVGFAHESPMSPYAQDPPALWPGLLDDIPDVFRAPVLDEPAFSISDTTFVIWREPDDPAWQASRIQLPDETDPDGAGYLLQLLIDDQPERYVEFAADYYERDLPLEPVAAIYRTDPLTTALVMAINPHRDANAARSEVAEMGYPLA